VDEIASDGPPVQVESNGGLLRGMKRRRR